MNDKEYLEEFLKRTEYMVLAVTLDDGTPWAVPVRLRQRKGNEFEWDSKLDTEHSRALTARPNIAVTSFEKKEETQFGIYLKGRAELIEEFAPGVGRYRFTASACWVNDQTFRKREVKL